MIRVTKKFDVTSIGNSYEHDFRKLEWYIEEKNERNSPNENDKSGEIDSLSHLHETNVCGLLPEALSADVQSILADETSLMCADAAASASLAVGARA